MKDIKPRNNNGSIIIQFSVNKRRFSFNPVPGGRWDEPRAMKKAEEIANQISLDILSGNFDPTMGKYKPNMHRGRTAADAQRDLDEARRIQAERDAVNAANLPDLFKRFTEFKAKTLKSNSLIDYNRIQNKLDKCPYKLVKEAREVMQWLVNDHKGNSTKSLEKQHKLINACCKWGVGMNELKFNPFDGLKTLIPTTKNSNRDGKKKYFTSEEKEEIVKAFKKSRYYNYYSPLVEFIFNVGCRPSEAIALQWKHVKGEKIHFMQKLTASGEIELGTKTEERRSITMNSKIKTILDSINAEFKKPEDLIFPAKKGGFIDWHNFTTRGWNSVLEPLEGIEALTPYHMRHTYITLALRAGADSAMVAKWVGNSPATIAKYYLGDVSDVEMPEI